MFLTGTFAAAVSTEMAGWYTANLERHFEDDGPGRRAVMYGNALRLFPRLAGRLGIDLEKGEAEGSG